MSLFNQMIRGGYAEEKMAATTNMPLGYVPRTFKETINDQIQYHQRKVTELQAVYDSLTPDIEKFVEAMQKMG